MLSLSRSAQKSLINKRLKRSIDQGRADFILRQIELILGRATKCWKLLKVDSSLFKLEYTRKLLMMNSGESSGC